MFRELKEAFKLEEHGCQTDWSGSCAQTIVARKRIGS